jgi:phosphatidylethanolamine/phosphatidyl-N-methylethanolamine N-methyltransferase
MKMTNRWNRFNYRLWAPIYDATVGHFFSPGRKRAMGYAAPKPGERVLLVGIGTGSDLELLPEGVEAVGIDLSPEMLRRCQSRLPLPGREVILIEGDVRKLLTEEAAFEVVLFNLILSVIPDAQACLIENLRALKHGGRAVVFDQFIPFSGNISPARKFLNAFSTLFGTDITRKFEEINAASGWEVIYDEKSLLKGMYRIILLKKMDPTP